jgi:hypothetical protein
MTKKEISFFVTVCLLLLLIFPLSGEEKVIELGGELGWNNFLTQKNIQKGSGRFGYQAIRISSASTELTDTTDLLLSFEDGTVSDSCNNYNVVSSSLSVNKSSIMGSYSALSRGNEGGLKLRGSKNAIFGKKGVVGSFSISFWLNPSIAENGETVFSWRSSREIDYKLIYQMIAGAFFNNKFEWTFTNVFSCPQECNSSFVLTSSSMVVPDTWSHHIINFDESTGLLEYYINGRLENLTYVTSNRQESGSVFQAVLGEPADIEIAPRFSGLIDDFCISNDITKLNVHHPMFSPEGGSFQTKPLGPFTPNSKIIRVESDEFVPEQTEIQLFVRGAENCFGWTDTTPEWVQVKDGNLLKPVAGSYFQLGARLYTDGNGQESPQLTSVNIYYQETEPPLPPFNVFSESGDGFAIISWIPSVDESTDGYLLYYGTAKGEYLGQSALEGDSPIDTRKSIKYKLTGLTNGKIYYFAVASYADTDTQRRVEGVMSKEIWVRPQRNMP